MAKETNMTKKTKIDTVDLLVACGAATEEEVRGWTPLLHYLQHKEYKNIAPRFFTEDGKYTVVFPLPFLCRTENGITPVLDLSAENISRLVGTKDSCLSGKESCSIFKWSTIIPCVAVVDGKLCVEDKESGQFARVFGNTSECRLLESDIAVLCGDNIKYCRSINLHDKFNLAHVFFKSKTPELVKSMDVESVDCPILDVLNLLARTAVKGMSQEVKQLLASTQEFKKIKGVLQLICEQYSANTSRKDRLYNWVYNLDYKLIVGLAEMLYTPA